MPMGGCFREFEVEVLEVGGMDSRVSSMDSMGSIVYHKQSVTRRKNCVGGMT